MVVSQGIIMEKIYKNLTITDEAAGDEWIWLFMNGHSEIIKPKKFIEINFRLQCFGLRSLFLAEDTH